MPLRIHYLLVFDDCCLYWLFVLRSMLFAFLGFLWLFCVDCIVCCVIWCLWLTIVGIWVCGCGCDDWFGVGCLVCVLGWCLSVNIVGIGFLLERFVCVLDVVWLVLFHGYFGLVCCLVFIGVWLGDVLRFWLGCVLRCVWVV